MGMTPSTGSSRPPPVASDEARLKLSAGQWEAIAAAQQRRLFAIHDLAGGITSKRLVTDAVAKEAEAICDLCDLPHAELVKKGLLS